MPNQGDTLYRIAYDTGELETVRFIEESLSDPGCTVTTFVVRGKGGQRCRCSKEMYVDTAQEAWERYLGMAREALPEAEQAVVNAQQHLDKVRAEIARIEAIVGGHHVAN